jgi:hypothetical protein
VAAVPQGMAPADAKRMLAAALLEQIDRRYAKDLWAWCCDQVMTIDEASQMTRLWPERQYLKELLAAFQECRLLAIPKSRRMFVSWGLAAACAWSARYHAAHAIMWQSETENKAAFVVDKRCKWIEEHLREPMLRRAFAEIKTSEGQVGRMTYDRTGSWILAVAQGPNVFRSYTPSIVVMDECEFQPQAELAVAAALPFAEKGAKLVLVSSSNGPIGPIASICREIGFVRFS